MGKHVACLKQAMTLLSRWNVGLDPWSFRNSAVQLIVLDCKGMVIAVVSMTEVFHIYIVQ